MKKLLELLKPYRKKLVAVAIIDAFGMMTSLLMPFVMSEIVEKGIAKANTEVVWKYAFIMLVLAILSTLGTILSSRINSSVGADFTSRLCQSTFEKINSLSYTDYSKKKDNDEKTIKTFKTIPKEACRGSNN